MAISKELKNLVTKDYQNRNGEYPKSNIPDSITVSEVGENIDINIDFKNTDEKSINSWYNSSKEKIVIDKYKNRYEISTVVTQDGEYKDDWVQLQINLIKKSAKSKKASIVTIATSKPDDKEFTYTYVLSSPSQIEAINLLEYKDKLQTIIKDYFKDKLVSVLVDKMSYTLNLTSTFTVGEKRRLGRLISQNTDLKKYVKKIAYNNAQDSSGQLFVMKKESRKVQDESAK